MTTDNRTNEPTPEQVEAAVHAAWAKSREFRGVGGQADFAPPWEFQQIIRAALVAAQGAAPQAESEELAWYKVAAKHSADSMAEARATLQMFADRVDPFVFDELSSVLDDQPLDYETGDVIGEVAPVLPSSGVDVAKIESLIMGRTATAGARAVAAWLKDGAR